MVIDGCHLAISTIQILVLDGQGGAAPLHHQAPPDAGIIVTAAPYPPRRYFAVTNCDLHYIPINPS